MKLKGFNYLIVNIILDHLKKTVSIIFTSTADIQGDIL